MNEQTTKLIEQLAQKLGTTTEFIWEVLIKQAYISAITDIIYIVLIIIVGILIFKKHYKFSKIYKDDFGTTSEYDESESKIIFMIAIGMLWLIAALYTFFSIGNIIEGFANPEYWALKQILDAIK